MDIRELASHVDAYASLDSRLTELNKLVETVKSERARIKAVIIEQMKASNLTACGGVEATVTIATKSVPSVVSWDDLWDYIAKHGRFDLLHKRVTEAAVKEMWDNGELVPGVNALPVDTLGISRAKQKLAAANDR